MTYMHHSHYIAFCNALWPTCSAPRERVGLELGGCLHWLSPLALCCTGWAIYFFLRINGQQLNELYVLLNFRPNLGLWYHTTVCSNLMNNHNLQVVEFTKHILIPCALSWSRGIVSAILCRFVTQIITTPMPLIDELFQLLGDIWLKASLKHWNWRWKHCF